MGFLPLTPGVSVIPLSRLDCWRKGKKSERIKNRVTMHETCDFLTLLPLNQPAPNKI